LALLGSRVPNSLRIFVLSLAIIDDIGAILVIAVGYSHGFHAIPFSAALLGVAVTAIMQWLGVRPVLAYWFVGFLTWAALHESGIHPTIAGVALGLLTPVTPWVDPNRLDRFLTWAKRAPPTALEADSGHKPKSVRRKLARAAQESIAPQQRLEDDLHPWSAFFVLPLFAIANAGVAVSVAGVVEPITLAIVAGLAIGKPVRHFQERMPYGLFVAGRIFHRTGSRAGVGEAGGERRQDLGARIPCAVWDSGHQFPSFLYSRVSRKGLEAFLGASADASA
jgi:NhaA family Na+:H+ antiporter